VQIAVLNANYLVNDYIGRVSVPMMQLVENNGTPMWFSLGISARSLTVHSWTADALPSPLASCRQVVAASSIPPQGKSFYLCTLAPRAPLQPRCIALFRCKRTPHSMPSCVNSSSSSRAPGAHLCQRVLIQRH